MFLRVRVFRISAVRLPFSGSQGYPSGFLLRKKKRKGRARERWKRKGKYESASLPSVSCAYSSVGTSQFLSARILPFETWGSKCKDRSGALRARTLFLFLHNRVSFWLCPRVQSSGDLVTRNNLTARLLSSEGRLGTRLCPAK